MNLHKIILSLAIFALGIVLVSVFWQQAIILSFLLVALAFVKHTIFPLDRELAWFVLIGALGAGGESIIIFSGPWFYAQPQLINMPIWLPFLWGLAGSIGVTLYSGITESK